MIGYVGINVSQAARASSRVSASGAPFSSDDGLRERMPGNGSRGAASSVDAVQGTSTPPLRFSGTDAAASTRSLFEAALEKARDGKADEAKGKGPKGPNDLTPEEQQAVDKLRARDREVRTHEQAHKAVGGRYAGAISYTYQEGPDGKRYAIGGEVPIDASPESDPKATIAKMRVIIAAALAPAEPSAADKSVAQFAQSQLTQASAQVRIDAQEASAARLEEMTGSDKEDEASLTAHQPTDPYTVFTNEMDRPSLATIGVI